MDRFRFLNASIWRALCVLPLLWLLPNCTQGPFTETTQSDAGGSELQGERKISKVTRRWTFRLLAGVSMGAGMAGIVGLRHPDKFDLLGIMGGPVHHRYMVRFLHKIILGGFCSLAQLQSAAKKGTLNTKAAYCHNPTKTSRFPYELMGHYNDWTYSEAGGNWNRTNLIRVLQDLFLALGNPGYENPNSTYWPYRKIPIDRRKIAPGERCSKPLRFPGVLHKTFNPEGKYDVITFCDGTNARSGTYRPDKPGEHTQPVEIWLAVDINGNGKRDYGEPILFSPYEEFKDTGVDGCSNDREDGKGGCLKQSRGIHKGQDPNKDDFDPVQNPGGTENNLRYDSGEPFLDNGLDGVPGSKDKGEGDGLFTISSGFAHMLTQDPGELIARMPFEKLKRLNIYMDAGIRDLFNFHVSTLLLYSSIRARYPNPKDVQLIDRFISLMPEGSKVFDPLKVDWSTKGKHIYVRYGNPLATPEEIKKGDGDHVHGGRIVDRILNFFYFATHHLPIKDMNPAPIDRSKGEGSPKDYVYSSSALGKKHIYTILLPPGFYARKNVRYPVAYLGHGYGMSGPDLGQVLSFFMVLMSQGYLAKMILVSIHGKCEQWLPVDGQKGKYKKSPFPHCRKGTFFINGKGMKNNGAPMEDVFFEIVNEVENKLGARILQPQELPVE